MATVEQLQARVDALHLSIKIEALEQIRWLMNRHGLTVADLDKSKIKRLAVQLDGKRERVSVPQVGKPGSVKAAVKPLAPRKRGKQPPKYRDPKTGATWSGIARAPAWIANVKNRDKFLIK